MPGFLFPKQLANDHRVIVAQSQYMNLVNQVNSLIVKTDLPITISCFDTDGKPYLKSAWEAFLLACDKHYEYTWIANEGVKLQSWKRQVDDQ